MRAAGKIFIILGIMAAIGAILSEGQVVGGLVALLLLGGIGSLLLYAAGAKNRKYRRLGEQTNTYYEQIRVQPQKEQLAQAQPPAATRSQSLEAGLFDE